MSQFQKKIEQNGFLKTLFNSIPCSVMVINQDFKIQLINDYWEQVLDGRQATVFDKSIGEALSCISVKKNPGACMKSGYCKNCHIFRATTDVFDGKPTHRQRTRIQIKWGNSYEDRVLLITASPFNYDDEMFAIILLEDITELSKLRLQVRTQMGYSGFIGRDPRMLELFESIEELSQVDVPVLIQGESGTGKELAAHAIHNEGLRAHKPFIAVNCAAIPETLLESELFGHVRGAFTGAIRDKKGRFELADGGTIFLDEISDISPMMQVKLLRVLQEGTFEKVGGEKTQQVNVRVISATNKNIHKEITAGRFRDDLFYRLCVVPLNVPPLRDRKTDIALLAEHFLKEALISQKKENIVLTPSAIKALQQYHWPGNIRELQNAIHYALVKCKGQAIEMQHLPPLMLVNYKNETAGVKRQRKRKLNVHSVRDALSKTNGNKVLSARLLGVSRATLYRFLNEAGI